MTKAIIFDLFGTLTYSGCNPEKKIIEKFNLKHSEKEAERFVCGTIDSDFDSYLQKVLEGLSVPKTKENTELLRTIFQEDSKKAVPIHGLESVIKSLTRKGYKIGMISNSPNRTYDVIRKYSLQSFFDDFIYSHECGLLKPDKKIFELALANLGVDAKSALMVGDSIESDIKGAQNAGIPALLIAPNNKRRTYAGPRVNSLAEVLTYVQTQLQ